MQLSYRIILYVPQKNLSQLITFAVAQLLALALRFHLQARETYFSLAVAYPLDTMA